MYVTRRRRRRAHRGLRGTTLQNGGSGEWAHSAGRREPLFLLELLNILFCRRAKETRHNVGRIEAVVLGKEFLQRSDKPRAPAVTHTSVERRSQRRAGRQRCRCGSGFCKRNVGCNEEEHRTRE